MNKILVLGLLALVGMPGEALALPRLSNVEFRLNHGDMVGPNVQLGYQTVSNKVQLLKCRFDISVLGGTTGTAKVLKAVDGSKCMLPSKAVVINGMIDVITAPVAPLPATISVGTGLEVTNDLVSGTSVSSFTGRQNLIPVHTAVTAIKLPADRTPVVKINTAAITVGKFNVFIEYLLGD